MPVGAGLMVRQHLLHCTGNIRIRNPVNIMQRDPITAANTLGKHIAVQIHLLQIGEHRLAVLHDRQRSTDARNVVFCIFQIVQNQIRKINEHIVIDLTVFIFARQRTAAGDEFLLCIHAQYPQHLLLFRAKAQLQLADVVERIADLMHNPERNQLVRRKSRIHMRMKIGTELAFRRNTGAYNGFRKRQLIVPRLRHQGFGNGRYLYIEMNVTIALDPGRLPVSERKQVKQTAVAIIVSRHNPLNNEITFR